MGKKITAALTVMMLIFATGCGADDIGIQAKSIDDINIADYTDAPEIPPKAETITCRADNYRMTVSLDTDENVLSGDITMTVNNMTDYGVQSDEEYRDWMDTLVEQREKSEIDRPVNEYDVESQEYSRVVYSDGALFLYELNQSMGDSAFYSMLQSYCRAYKFRESSTEEFLGIVKQYSDTDETRDIVNRYFSD